MEKDRVDEVFYGIVEQSRMASPPVLRCLRSEDGYTQAPSEDVEHMFLKSPPESTKPEHDLVVKQPSRLRRLAIGLSAFAALGGVGGVLYNSSTPQEVIESIAEHGNNQSSAWRDIFRLGQ